MENIIKTIEADIEDISKKIGILSNYIEKENKTEEETLLQMQMFQMLQYRDSLESRLNKLV
jgi:hypothetical protein